MHGGRLLARALAAHGVRHLFGLCGDHVNAIFEGAHDEGIRIVDARDERAAGHMAEGWSLATGAPGVVCVTGGPGLTNAMTPIADAFHAGVPLLVLTSRIRLSEAGRGYPQDVDQMALVASTTVHSRTVFDVERIPMEVAEALAQARARRGPAFLEVPLDAQLARAVGSTGAPAAPPPVASPAVPEPGALDAAAKILGEAHRPVAVIGEGAFWSAGAAEALRRFAEAARVPVFTVRAARGLLPDAHPLCFGQPNYLRGAGQAAFARADALLVAGCELDIVLAFGAFAPEAPLIRIERDAARAVRSRRPDVAIVADEASALAALADRLDGRAEGEWVSELRRASDEDQAARAADRTAAGSPVHPARLVAELSGAAGERATFAVDAGALALWALDSLPATGPGRLLSSFTTPLATIGPGIPFAIAAKLARPEEPAVALVGDGAFGFSAMEVDTAARHGVGVAVVVGNDAAWGIVKRQMEMGFGRAIATDLVARRYDLVGAALGAIGERIEDAAALGPALRRAIAGPDPFVVDVLLDPGPEHDAMKFIAAMFAPEGGASPE